MKVGVCVEQLPPPRRDALLDEAVREHSLPLPLPLPLPYPYPYPYPCP